MTNHPTSPQVSPRRRKIGLTIITVIMALGVVSWGILIVKGDAGPVGQLFHHAGPSKMVSLGVARFISCEYEGTFVGGAGFRCVIKNTSNQMRDVSVASCAGFDDSDRLIDSPQNVLALYGPMMRGGEERVIRLYVPETSSVAVCSETGDLGSPSQLSSVLPDFRKNNLVSEFGI